MTEKEERLICDTGFTKLIARHASDLVLEAIPTDAAEIARQCLLDWMGVTVAGSREPATEIVLATQLEEASGTRGVTVVGRSQLLPPSAAALVNGTASHALDYDDANSAMFGHPTAPVLGALLALAESRGASGPELLVAFVAGYETECRVAVAMGKTHYSRGYHATGTLGTLGAAAACARLLRLDTEGTATALGLAATQAAGLKSMFGTMAKPLHVGKAAFNGLLAARLAARDFTAEPNAVEVEQGLAATLAGSFDANRGLRDLGDRWFIQGNLFKYHASCYETHSAIEGLRALRRQASITADDVGRVVIHANDLQFGMCTISTPLTGLESKFSLRHVAALALEGADTAAIECFGDERVHVPSTVALRERVEVKGDGPSSGGTPVEVYLADGRILRATHDSHVPATDLDAQDQRLREKTRRLAEPVLGVEATRSLIDAVASIDDIADIGEITRLTRISHRIDSR